MSQTTTTSDLVWFKFEGNLTFRNLVKQSKQWVDEALQVLRVMKRIVLNSFNIIRVFPWFLVQPFGMWYFWMIRALRIPSVYNPCLIRAFSLIPPVHHIRKKCKLMKLLKYQAFWSSFKLIISSRLICSRPPKLSKAI